MKPDLSELFASENMASFMEKMRADSFLAGLQALDRKPRSQTITFPLLPEFSKEPLDAELVVEDILDAELIG